MLDGQFEATKKWGRMIKEKMPVAAAPPEPLPSTPAAWFDKKYPKLAARYGNAVQEKFPAGGKGRSVVTNLSEDFLAATLGKDGTPTAPTVFVVEEDKFYAYSPNDGIFKEVTEPALAMRLSKLLLECALACRRRFDTQALEFRLRDSSKLRGVLVRARGLLEVRQEFFETSLKKFVPCDNGMLRIADRKLLRFCASYRRCNKLAVAYVPGATCPLFLDTLMRSALDEDDLELMQRWCGLALLGVNYAQRLVILQGTAGGGKGTLIRVITGILGSNNVGTLRPQLLHDRFELGGLVGKSLLYGPDVDENFFNCKGASVLKAVTGGDPGTVEFKGSNNRPQLTCRFNVIVTCNCRLTVHLQGDAEAWQRRLVIVEYKNPKPKNLIAEFSEQILEHEASGVLNWMLEGLDKVLADGLQLRLTAAQQKRVNDLLLESDSVMVFAKERLREDGSNSLTFAQCHDAYVQFCSNRGWVEIRKNHSRT